MAITRRRQRGNLLFSTAAVLALLSAAIPHNQSICRADDVVVAESSPDADVAAADVTDLLEEAIDAASVADAVVDDLDDKISEGDSSSVAEETTSEDDLDKVLNTLEEDGILTQEEHVAASADAAAEGNTADQVAGEEQQTQSAPVQSGPFIDLFGDVLLSLEMVDETHAQVHQHYTNEALSGKKVVGLYFSADWCGPCRQFTPDLVNFYDKMNARRGKKDEFEIVWVSRCRSVDDFGQYFTHMKWLALPPQEAMGQRGQYLGEKYKVKSIPTLVLLDEIGNVITTDARNKIPMDKAGIGFPWRSPMSILISTLLPKSLRLLVKSQLDGVFVAIRGTVGKKTGGGGFLSKFREAVAGKVGGQR